MNDDIVYVVKSLNGTVISKTTSDLGIARAKLALMTEPAYIMRINFSEDTPQKRVVCRNYYIDNNTRKIVYPINKNEKV